MGKCRWQVLVPLLPLLIGSWLLMAFLHPDMGIPPNWIGNVVFCTLFVQTTIASAWVALGPLPFLWRFPLSICWVVCLVVAAATNMALITNKPWGEAFLFFGVIACGNWMFVQIPFWVIVQRFSLALEHFTFQSVGPAKRQFGILQVLILTTIVATVLALARAVVLYLDVQDNRTVAPIGIGLLVIMNVIVMSPLILAPLLPRNALVGTAISFAMIYFSTWAEGLILAGLGMGMPFYYLLAGNYYQSIWAAVISGTLRICGYSLFARGLKHS